MVLGLRARLGLCDERTDDEIIDDAEHDEVVAELDPEASALLLFAPELGPILCEADERGGAAEVRRVLREMLATLSGLDRARVRRWGEGRFRPRSLKAAHLAVPATAR